MKAKIVVLCALIGLAAGGWLALNNWYAAPSGPARPNVILVSIDTLRADRLGSYGYARDTSPAADALARRGTLFLNAVSTSHWTLPSHVTMFTGLYPSNHQSRGSSSVIKEEVRLLAEILKERGYRTYAFTGGGYVSKRFGFGRGFDLYLEDKAPVTSGNPTFAKMIEHTEEELAKLEPGAPYFVFLHTYDVHCPYAPTEPYRERFRSEKAVYINPHSCGGTTYNHMGEQLTPQKVLYLSDQYDSSIREMDDNLARLLAFLDRRADRAETVVIFTSDHGDEFFEHGRIGHQRSLYRELLMVPLIIQAPWLAPQKVETPVSMVDLFPTVLELLNVKPPSGLDGQSLLPFMLAGDAAPPLRPFQYSEAPKMRSSIDGKFHLILELQSSRNQLFDFVSDRSERDNLASKQREYVNSRGRELLEMSATMKDATRKESWVWERFPGEAKPTAGVR